MEPKLPHERTKLFGFTTLLHALFGGARLEMDWLSYPFQHHVHLAE
jgi:hypothetical protein